MNTSIKKIISPSLPLMVILILIAIGVWLLMYISNPTASIPADPSQFGYKFFRFLNENSLLLNLASLVLTILNGFLLLQLNNRFTLIQKRTFLPTFLYILLISTWSETHIYPLSHLALTCIILSVFSFLDMYRNPKNTEEAFLGSILIALASLIYTDALFLIVICWFGFIVFQCLSLRTFLASIIGIITPWILYIAGLLIFSTQTTTIHQHLSELFSFRFAIPTVSNPVVIYTSFLIIIFLIGLVGMFSESRKDSVRTKRSLYFLIILLLGTLFMTIFNSEQYVHLLPVIAMLYSLLVSHSFSLKQSSFYTILFYIFCALHIGIAITTLITSLIA